MKLKHLPFLMLLALFSLAANAQKISVPNASFEDWDSSITPPAPQGWSTCDPLYNALGGQTHCVSASEDHYTGKLSMMVTSDTLSFTGQPTLFPGFAITQFPTTLRNSYFSGYYRAVTNPGDTQLVVVMFSRYNPTKEKSDTIGMAYYLFGSATTWTQFISPINYLKILNPDSVSIEVFSNTHKGANTLSYLKLDDIGFVNNLDVNNITFSRGLNIYPNPAANNFTLHYISDNSEAAQVNLYDINGRLISHLFDGRLSDGANDLKLSTEGIANGTYIIKLQTATGIFTGHLMIIK